MVEHISHEHILAEIRSMRESHLEWRELIVTRLDAVEQASRANAEMTMQVRDAIVAARLAHTVLKWAAGLVASATVLWLAFKNVVLDIVGKNPAA